MGKEEDILLGKIALANRFITKEQLKECVMLQNEGRKEPLGTLLHEKGYITKKNLDKSVTLHEKQFRKPHTTLKVQKKDVLFGRLAIKLRMANKDQVHEA